MYSVSTALCHIHADGLGKCNFSRHTHTMNASMLSFDARFPWKAPTTKRDNVTTDNSSSSSSSFVYALCVEKVPTSSSFLQDVDTPQNSFGTYRLINMLATGTRVSSVHITYYTKYRCSLFYCFYNTHSQFWYFLDTSN